MSTCTSMLAHGSREPCLCHRPRVLRESHIFFLVLLPPELTPQQYLTGPGAQTAAAQGKGWVEEFLARLTHTPIAKWNSNTNSTLDGNTETFPVNQTIYADA